MVRSVDTVIVGAGHAGLVISDLLTRAGEDHVLLERRAALGGGWQDRWDNFQLVSPNWTTGMPSLPYDGDDPDGFMPRDEIIERFRRYAATIDAPVELGTDVTRLTTGPHGGSPFRLATSRGPMSARRVIVAGGPFGRAHVPALAGGLDASILSLHVDAYRNPGQLPDGGVYIVGSGQSGVQLAEELQAAGRAVTLAVGSCGRNPRRYRGRDIFWWLRELATRGRTIGTPLVTPDRLPSSAARLGCNPHLSGHDGGHDTNLRRLAAGGIRLTGRLEAIDGVVARCRPNLAESLARADAFFDERLRGLIDAFVERIGEPFPPGEVDQFAYEAPEVERLDLRAEGISTVLWSSGYRPAFEWIDLDVFDEVGLPRQEHGLTDIPGLGFIGTPWLVDMGSANLVGVVRDAEALVEGLLAQP